MTNICFQCGIYRADKIIDPDGPFAICPECGNRRHFERLPLLIVSGASGSGKSTVCQILLGRRPFDSWMPLILMRKLPPTKLNYGSMRSSGARAIQYEPLNIRPVRNKNHAKSHSPNHSDCLLYRLARHSVRHQTSLGGQGSHDRFHKSFDGSLALWAKFPGSGACVGHQLHAPSAETTPE